MKKIALLLVCFLMSLAYTAIADTCGDYKYTLLDDGTAEITRYTGTSEIVDIPEKLDGKFVSSIGASSFRDCECIISVTIPDSVKIIDDKAFYSCGSLTSVIIPDSITTIGDEAFYACERLSSIKIPDGVTSIGDYAFYSIDMLTSITIPNSVMSIGANPFCGCNPLIEINVSPQHPAFEMIDGVLFSKADKRLIYYPRGSASSSYAIPQGIAVIGDAAFKLSENLNTVIIPDSVTTIGSQAFMASFDDLTVIIPDSVTTIGAGAFSMCTNLSLMVESNSYAEQYAIEKNYNYTPITSSEKTLMNEHKEERVMGYLIIGLICVIAIVAIVRHPVKRRNKKSKEESSAYSSSPSNYSTTVNTSTSSAPVSNSSFQVSNQEDVTLPQDQNTNKEEKVLTDTKSDNPPVAPENSSNTEPQLSKFQQLLNRAESNDPEAMFEVGRAYENGEDIEKDEQKAIYWFEKASELGHAAASNLCGLYCSKANDASRSFEYFKKAYNLGNIAAALNLGNCYEDGKGTNKDLKAAIDCYNFALNKGDNSGAYCLGFLYMDAGDEKNEKFYFAKAAEMKHPHGTAVYGIILQQEGKLAQAFEYFKKAKELGNAQGALLLGDCYENGKGVEKNIDTAIECYKFALEKGDSRGANNLCYIYEVMGDIEKVKFYSSKSMELNDSSGFHTYGSCLEKEKNYTEALKYYQKGYELNDEVAAWRLGLLYQNGYGTQKDLLKAVDLFRFAIDNGCVAAINSLAFICNDDDFKGLDEFTKFKYLKMADDAGYEGYCCALAEHYYYGEGVEKNIHKCLEYAEKVYMQNKNCTDTLSAISRSHDALKCTIMVSHIFEWERSDPEIANACVAFFTKMADYGDIGYIDKIAKLSIFDETYCDYSKAWKYSQQLINHVQKSDYASDLKSSLESNGHLYIGIMLAGGLGVQRDIQQGLAHLRKAKDLGNKNAEKILNDL